MTREQEGAIALHDGLVVEAQTVLEQEGQDGDHEPVQEEVCEEADGDGEQDEGRSGAPAQPEGGGGDGGGGFHVSGLKDSPSSKASMGSGVKLPRREKRVGDITKKVKGIRASGRFSCMSSSSIRRAIELL